MAVGDYAELAAFVAVAEHASIARASDEIGLSRSQISRTLTRLEERLGVRLMHRTTRRITLTEEGKALFERARAAFSDLDEAEAAVGEALGTARGRLRVTLPVTFGHRFVAPIAARFAAEHPLVTVDLAFEDRKVDLVEEGFDVGVRVGLSEHPGLVAKRLAAARVLVVASPAYLEKAAPLERPEDLAEHDVLPHDRELPNLAWAFGDVVVKPRIGRFVASNGGGLLQGAIAGLGVVRLPDFLVFEAVRAGQLVRLLRPWEDALPIGAVYPPGRHLAPKVRRFVDFLAEHLTERLWSCTSA
jgi:DNA-binding transcriptional LysR family regulator